MSKLDSFSLSLSPKDMTDEDWEKVNDVLNSANDELLKYITEVAKELNVSEECATQVVYLRTRARWTQELEDKLIMLHMTGEPPENMSDFG